MYISIHKLFYNVRFATFLLKINIVFIYWKLITRILRLCLLHLAEEVIHNYFNLHFLEILQHPEVVVLFNCSEHSEN